MEKPILSKSTYIRGLQCEKSLYLYKHNYNLRDGISTQLQAIFNQGTNVGNTSQNIPFLIFQIYTPPKSLNFMKMVSFLLTNWI